MNKARKQNRVIIYQAKTGAIELLGDFKRETIWATQAQIASLFDTQRPAITKHLNNIFKSRELNRNSVSSILEHTATDGKKYKTQFYNLDAIISVGYRVNSATATKFRQWATKTLRQHITKGYTINPKIIKNNYTEFQKAVENIRQLLPAGAKIDNASVLELVSAFADTWLSLEAYDEDKLSAKGVTKKAVALTGDQLDLALFDFKKILIKKKEATELFGQTRQKDAISGIVGNVMQSFGGKNLYPTVEEKAAHLLYFMVKNHPYVDGNKRSGAYAFIWFLKKAGVLDISRITPPALTAITLFIAESNPKHKDKMIRLVLQMLKK